MTSIVQIGTEIAVVPRVASCKPADPTLTLASLQDLLDLFQQEPPSGHAMLKSTAGKLSEFFRRPCGEILLGSLREQRSDFRQFLVDRTYTSKSIRSYMNYVRILLKNAKKSGWTYLESDLPAAWTPLSAAAASHGCGYVLKHFARQGRHPSSITEEDLSAWVQIMVQQGHGYLEYRRAANDLRKILRRAGFTANFSDEKTRFKASLGALPAELRREVDALLKWKQDKFVPGRPNKCKVREVTALQLLDNICKLYGYATTIASYTGISSLRQLFTEEIVTNYARWMLEERRTLGNTVKARISRIHAALRHHPEYKDMNLSWVAPLKGFIPEDDPEELENRKNQKYVPYDRLIGIPGLLRSNRPKAEKRGSKSLALEVRNELIIQWLLILPWRQRNIRELRVGGRDPNLFKCKLPAISSMSTPAWVKEAVAVDPNSEFWQFKFTADETKMKNSLQCVLPRKLVGLLDEYLQSYRKELAAESDPGTLFLNEKGGALTQAQVSTLVSRLTLRYCGRIVTPHLFRDIYAFMWLEKRPEDFLTLSKLLWHRNIATTINKYGRRFNESAALCRMEEVLQ